MTEASAEYYARRAREEARAAERAANRAAAEIHRQLADNYLALARRPRPGAPTEGGLGADQGRAILRSERAAAAMKKLGK